MGARANYVIIEDGAIDIYYSHWGAMYVPEVVIDGPEATRAYIRDEAPTTGSLMNDIWAEGGILLDMDRRSLLFFGGENIRFSPPWQRIFLHMMRSVWQGWSVAWAARGIVDIGAYPGVAESLRIDPASLIQSRDRVIEQAYDAAKIRNPHENPWIYTVITVTWEDGQVADYTFDSALDGYLLFGPDLLVILREREPDTLPREEDSGAITYFNAPDQDPREGVYINMASRTMWVMHYRPPYSVKPESIEQIWHGWSVNERFEGLGYQVALSGRSSALVAAPYNQVEEEIIGDLMSGHRDEGSSDPSQSAHSEERRVRLTTLLQDALKRDQDGDLS